MTTHPTPCPCPDKCGVQRHRNPANCVGLNSSHGGTPPPPGTGTLDDNPPQLSDATEIGHFDDGSDEWLAARHHHVGGSDIPIVLGISPFSDRYQLWCRKTGHIGEATPTPLMEAGRYAELAHEAWYKDHCLGEGETLVNPGTMVNRDHQSQMHNPDRVVVDTDGTPIRLLEFKYSPNARHDDWGPDGTTHVPTHYWAQTQWGMSTIGVDEAEIINLGRNGFTRHRLQADHEWADMARAEADKFMEAVHSGTEPDWQPSQWSYEADRQRHPDINPDQTATIDADDMAIIARAQQANAALKEARAHAKGPDTTAKAVLAHRMGTAATAVDSTGQVVAHRRSRRNKDGEPGDPFVVLA